METELTTAVRKQIAGSLRVPEGQVHCTLDGDMVVVTVVGELSGRSAMNAMRRRQQALRAAKRVIANSDLQLSITFAVHDAVSIIEDMVSTTAAFVLGHTPNSVSVKVGRAGKTSVLVTLAEAVDDASARLTRAIAPILHRASLSLTEATVVSPLREDVSDARLLRAAKILAPCDGASVARRLKQRDDVDIPADLVHRRLDILRQKGLLVYLGDRRFALTLKGMASVPTSTRRDSSDIERVLAMAKSKW